MIESQVSESTFRIFRRFLPLYLGIFVSPLSGTGSFNMVPVFSRDFDVSISMAGLSITALILPSVISQIGSGVIAEKLGTTRTLVIGLLVFAVAGLFSAFAPDYPVFLISRAIQGFGGGLVLPIAMVVATDQVPTSRTAMVVGTIQSAFTLGTAIGPAVGGIFTDQIHWRGFFVFTSGCGAISAILIAAAYSGVPRETISQNPLRSLQQAVSIPGVRALSVIGFALFLSNTGIFIFIAVYLQTSGLAGATSTGLLLATAGIAGIIVSPIAGHLGDRFGIARAILVGIIISLIARIGLLGFPDVILLYPLLLFISGVGNAFTSTNVGALSVSLWPDSRRAISGVVSGFRFLGLAMTPILFSPVYEAASIGGVLIVSSVALLASALLLQRVGRG
jgi:predicted MFS family arabinose efflux permease